MNLMLSKINQTKRTLNTWSMYTEFKKQTLELEARTVMTLGRKAGAVTGEWGRGF